MGGVIDQLSFKGLAHKLRRGSRQAFAAASVLLWSWPANAQDNCTDFLGCDPVQSVLPYATVFMVLLALAAAATLVWFWTTIGGRGGDVSELIAQLKRREWPAAVTPRRGNVLFANEALRRSAPQSQTILGMLDRLVGLDSSELYRLSRLALKDGLAVEGFERNDTGEPVALMVQAAGGGKLVWQLIPRNRISTLFPDDALRRYDSAPFCYVCFDRALGVVANNDFYDLFDDTSVDAIRANVVEADFAGGRLSLKARDGTSKSVLAMKHVTHRDGAQRTEVFLFIAEHEAATQLSAAETLESVPVSLLHLDENGRVIWGNVLARQMLGDTFKSGRMLEQMMQPLGRPMSELVNTALTQSDGTSGEMVRLKDESFDTFAQITLTQITLHGQRSLWAVLTDASELRQLEDKFAQSSKMEAVGKLAGGVAHDFNNVLTAISGHCDLLLLRKDPSHPDFSDLTQIRQNSNRAATLVRQLLAFSRKQTLQPKLLSVQDVVTETLYLLDRLIGEKITLSLDHDRALGSVRADNQQLEQALMNLVVNARDAMPNGGTVTIATRNRTLNEEERHPGVAIPPGEYVEISVADNGTGIEPNVIDKVFDPFFTTKPQGEGTGLGLSTVYGIVKQSGGYIYAENRPSGGAAFTILLPTAYPEQNEINPPVVEQKEEAARPDLTGQGAVLLVEDEAPVRSFASRALRLRGYRVIEAESAEEAMQLLDDGFDDIDVLVSDVMMPGMDGPTFAAKAREMRPTMRVIFISGYAEDSFRRNLKDRDFLFLPKPFSLNELTSKVKQAMERKPLEKV